MPPNLIYTGYNTTTTYLYGVPSRSLLQAAYETTFALLAGTVVVAPDRSFSPMSPSGHTRSRTKPSVRVVSAEFLSASSSFY